MAGIHLNDFLYPEAPRPRPRGKLAPIYLMGPTEYALMSQKHQTQVPMENYMLMRPYFFNLGAG